uniref:Reverse transcriptase zinc-binding domain-containing protein n=1 Tax=Hordeum vulgare subsp. vulgare TaxID=112509 RepID=A0A8I7BHK6_HORVV
MNIARRGVVLDTSCVVCHRLFEDGGHLFFRCKGVKPLWRGLQIEDIRMQLMECQGPIHVLECILKLPYEKKMMIVALLWAWWSERNKTNHNESRLSTDEFIFLIKRSTDEWLRFSKPPTKSSTTSTPRWTCPSAEIIKINTDGAFLEETRDRFSYIEAGFVVPIFRSVKVGSSIS